MTSTASQREAAAVPPPCCPNGSWAGWSRCLSRASGLPARLRIVRPVANVFPLSTARPCAVAGSGAGAGDAGRGHVRGARRQDRRAGGAHGRQGVHSCPGALREQGAPPPPPPSPTLPELARRTRQDVSGGGCCVHDGSCGFQGQLETSRRHLVVAGARRWPASERWRGNSG